MKQCIILFFILVNSAVAQRLGFGTSINGDFDLKGVNVCYKQALNQNLEANVNLSFLGSFSEYIRYSKDEFEGNSFEEYFATDFIRTRIPITIGIRYFLLSSSIKPYVNADLGIAKIRWDYHSTPWLYSHPQKITDRALFICYGLKIGSVFKVTDNMNFDFGVAYLEVVGLKNSFGGTFDFGFDFAF